MLLIRIGYGGRSKIDQRWQTRLLVLLLQVNSAISLAAVSHRLLALYWRTEINHCRDTDIVCRLGFTFFSASVLWIPLLLLQLLLVQL